MARVPAVARPAPVLADRDLLAENVTDDARGHGRGLRRDVRFAVAAEKQHFRPNGLALVLGKTVHEQTLALPDAVLLAAESDDRVGNGRRMRAPARGPSVATATSPRSRAPAGAPPPRGRGARRAPHRSRPRGRAPAGAPLGRRRCGRARRGSGHNEPSPRPIAAGLRRTPGACRSTTAPPPRLDPERLQ